MPCHKSRKRIIHAKAKAVGATTKRKLHEAYMRAKYRKRYKKRH